MRSDTDRMLGTGVDFCPGCHALERRTQIVPDAAHPGVVETRPNTLALTPSTRSGSWLANRLSYSDALFRIPWCGVASWVAV